MGQIFHPPPSQRQLSLPEHSRTTRYITTQASLKGPGGAHAGSTYLPRPQEMALVKQTLEVFNYLGLWWNKLAHCTEDGGVFFSCWSDWIFVLSTCTDSQKKQIGGALALTLQKYNIMQKNTSFQVSRVHLRDTCQHSPDIYPGAIYDFFKPELCAIWCQLQLTGPRVGVAWNVRGRQGVLKWQTTTYS